VNDPAVFRQHLDTVFRVSHGASQVPLRLADVAEEPPARGVRQFSLFFHGPGDPQLPQAIHTFEHDALGTLELFIVPVIGSTRERIVYQAAFNLLAPPE
jgi:hypothetical protein